MHDKWIRVGGTLAVTMLVTGGLAVTTHAGIGTALVALFLFVCVPLLILTTADAIGTPLMDPGVVPIERAPDEFQYEFVSTTEDLLTAQEASFREGTGIRRWVRWGPVVYGWCAFSIGLGTLGSEDANVMQNILWIGIGAVLICSFQIYPFIVRRSIRKHRAARAHTKLRFTAAGILAEDAEGQSVALPWEELVEYDPQPEGIRFSFEYEHSTWLPNRVFASEQEAAQFVDAIQAWLQAAMENAIREQERKERHWGLREAEFWELIGLLDPRPGATDPVAFEGLVDALAEHEVEEIKGFQDILAEQLFLLDSYAHFEGMRGEDPDFVESAGPEPEPGEEDFLGARCLVVASGRRATRALRRFPAAMPKADGMPGLVDVAALAYEKKCGEPFRFQPIKSFAKGSNAEGWAAGASGSG